MTGMYEIPDRVITFDTGLNQAELEQAKADLREKVSFNNGWVYVVNSSRYNSFKGEKNETAKNKELHDIPSEIVSALTSKKPDRVSESGDRVSTNGDTSITIINNHNHSNKKGGAGGKQYPTPEAIDDSDLQKIADRYRVPLSFVRSKLDDMVNWEGAKGKRQYRNYYLALCDWVKKDSLKIKQDHAKITSRIAIDPTQL